MSYSERRQAETLDADDASDLHSTLWKTCPIYRVRDDAATKDGTLAFGERPRHMQQAALQHSDIIAVYTSRQDMCLKRERKWTWSERSRDAHPVFDKQ